MTGPEHFRRAEQLAVKASEYLGQGDGQDSAAIWAAVAQVHATLALAAASALAPSRADDRAWIKAAGPEPSPFPRAARAPKDSPSRSRGGPRTLPPQEPREPR